MGHLCTIDVGSLFDPNVKFTVTKEQRAKILKDRARSAAEHLTIDVVHTAFAVGKSTLPAHIKDECELNLSLNAGFLHSSMHRRTSRKSVVATINSFVRDLNKIRKLACAERIASYKVVRLNPFPEGWYFGNPTKRSIEKSKKQQLERVRP